jgi:small-conductance mechanosensitive channel
MADNKTKAEEIVKGIASLIGMENTKLTSELAEGEYMLEDGTKFRIDAEGNLVDVVAPDAAEAEAEEAAKREEEEVAMAAVKKPLEDEIKSKTEEIEALTEKLKLATEKSEELEEEVVKLSKTKKIVTAPKKGDKVEKIELTSHMTYQERVQARLYNTLNK